jgi:hypothetical protein
MPMGLFNRNPSDFRIAVHLKNILLPRLAHRVNDWSGGEPKHIHLVQGILAALVRKTLRELGSYARKNFVELSPELQFFCFYHIIFQINVILPEDLECIAVRAIIEEAPGWRFCMIQSRSISDEYRKEFRRTLITYEYPTKEDVEKNTPLRIWLIRIPLEYKAYIRQEFPQP